MKPLGPNTSARTSTSRTTFTAIKRRSGRVFTVGRGDGVRRTSGTGDQLQKFGPPVMQKAPSVAPIKQTIEQAYGGWQVGG